MAVNYTASSTYGDFSVSAELPFISPDSIGNKVFRLDLSSYLTWTGNNFIQKFYRTDLVVENSEGNEVGNASYTPISGGTIPTNPYYNINLSTPDTYTLKYTFYATREAGSGVIIVYAYLDIVVALAYNRLPLKKWTVLDVVNRTFDLIETRRIGETAKFYINTGTGEKLDKIISPEFAFTKMNLREQLKQVGGFIHGEPRIKDVYIDDNAKRRYEVDFDFYGGNEYSNISNKKYVTATFGTDINEYCTSLDSSADNLVNQLDWAQGVIVEPFNNKSYYAPGRSLRTDNTAVGMTENDSSFIPTSLPIYSLGGNMKVTCVVINTINVGILQGRWDITPYIFEKTAYDNLSSYKGTYPYCKAYALYYEIGKPNIKGLWFKNENALSSVFENYAIVNILESLTGQKLELFKTTPGDETNRVAFDLQFQIEYLPIYSQRVKSNKQYFEKGIKREIAYNQSANLIETQYYGNNLKGVVERMGNVEKTYTYNLAFLSEVPRVGTKFDDEYYISTVSTEILPTFIKCTIALSKDFNRLSQYVGISSEKRMWEVSERQTQNRDSVYTEYLHISENETASDEDTFFTFRDNCAKVIFNNYSSINSQISSMQTQRYSIKQDPVGEKYISLPVVSSCFGNSMTFSSQFLDNYSAGMSIQHVSETGKQAAYGAPVPYNDYYGRFYYLRFWLFCGNELRAMRDSDGATGEIITMRDYPGVKMYNGVSVIDSGSKLIYYRKDSKEVPNITYELTAITDQKDIIIGSALMKNCLLVNISPLTFQLRVYNTKIPKFGELPTSGYTDITNGITINSNSITITANVSNVSWAIITTPSVKTIKVQDEGGEEYNQEIQTGGELLIGQNNPLSGSKTLYFAIKRDIYN